MFALFAASFSLFLLPEVGPDANLKENTLLEYQASIGFNTSKLGNADDAEDKQNIYTEFTSIENKNDNDVNLATISVK